MRRFLLVIFSALYILISVGFISYNVYCQNKLMRTSLIVENKNCEQCPHCKQNKCRKGDSCCKHSKEYIQLKVDQNYTVHHVDITPQQSDLLSICFLRYIIPDGDIAREETYPVRNAPPLGTQNPIHIFNCTYLI